MARRDEPSRYAYWSERAVQRVAQDMAVVIDPRWRTKISVLKVPLVQLGFDIERLPRTLFRNEKADRIERAVGDHAVEDFVTPPPVKFAKGTGSFVFSHFICAERGRVVLYTCTTSSDGTRIGVVLFGSHDNLPAWAGPNDPQPGGWTSSAMWSVLEWLQSECRQNSSQWDDPESISMEALRIATQQGTNDDHEKHPDQPWTRGFTFADTSEAEWFAEVYSDVILDKKRWHLDKNDVDRIVVGAPLWVRTPRTGLRRYRELRRLFNLRRTAKQYHLLRRG